MRLFTKRIITSLFICLALGCGKDEDGENSENGDNPYGDAFISTTIDGTTFKTNYNDPVTEGISGIEGDLSIVNNLFVIALGGEQLDGNMVDVVSVGFGNLSIDELEVGAIFTGNGNDTETEFALGVYQRLIDEKPVINAEGNAGCSIKITALNADKNVVSGEFSFVATDEDTGASYMVENGIFNNITLD